MSHAADRLSGAAPELHVSSRSPEAEAMRILHLTPSIHPDFGGLAALTLGFAQSHRVLGHAPQVWCTDSEARLEEARGVHGFPADLVQRFPAIAGLGLSLPMERAALARGADFAVLHQHGIWPMLSRVTNGWRDAFERPTVVAPQGSLEPPALRRSRWKKRIALATYEGVNLARTHCIQANSAAEARSVRDFGLRNPIAIIPNGFPEAWLEAEGDGDRFRHRHQLPSDRRLALFVGRIHPIKGLPLLVEAAARLQGRLGDWLFVLAGPDEGEHAREVRELARERGVEHLFHFTGPLYGHDKRDAYAAADAFVLPSLSESFGISVAEALGASVPAIATRGAPWEELQSHDCGWWVDATANGIAEGLEAMLDCSADRLREMGGRGKQLVAERYTWPRVGAQAVQLYEWLCGTRERPHFVLTD